MLHDLNICVLYNWNAISMAFSAFHKVEDKITPPLTQKLEFVFSPCILLFVRKRLGRQLLLSEIDA